MDNQIRELAIQSGLPTALDYHQKRYEKFAELILKECLKYIDDSFGDIDYVKFMIKRNFGVEE